MKKIVVLSDTHIPKAANDLPEAVYKELKNADMILHAGDFIAMSVLEKLQGIAPIRAVYGNMDMQDVRAALPQKDIINIDGLNIGLIHGYGPPGNIVKTVAGEFGKVNAIVFGHSHSAYSEKIRNTLFFNPGSPTDKIFASYNSFGILEVGVGKEIKGRIVRL